MPPAQPISLSVLIRTFNSAKTLDRVLSALKLQGDEEYIVVDSGSTDSTLTIAAAHGAKIIRAEGPFNYSKSLNLGFRAARHPWVHVISSHSISMVPDLLAIFREAASNLAPEIAAAYGPNSLDGSSPFAGEKGQVFAPADSMQIYPFCGNGNTLYRRSAWETLPFDEGIRTGEDKAWLGEIVPKGFRAVFVPAAQTINLSQYSLAYMFQKGYSDCRALPHESVSIFDLIMAFGSHTKKFLFGKMPFGNWTRYSAHIVGRFFASYTSQDNTPGK